LSLPGFVLIVQKKQLRTMLNSYFQHQTKLIDTDCNFRCPDDCNAPGCRKAGIIVEVTLFDLIKLGRFLNTPVSHLFSQHCRLGLTVCKYNIRYMNLLIKMKKPCLFLSGNQCSVHDVKPLSCRLFPELYQIQGVLPELSKRPLFHSFPCMRKPSVVSEMRKKAIRKLERMSLHEQALSYAYLFGIPNFIIDKKHLRKKLRQIHPKHRKLFLQDYDNLLNNLLKSYSFIESVKEKISRLDTESGINHLLEQLSDRVMMEDLIEEMVQPVVVHRLKRDGIKQLKRSVHPPAICFM
jgi:Fe-S-cluster containining protein